MPKIPTYFEENQNTFLVIVISSVMYRVKCSYAVYVNGDFVITPSVIYITGNECSTCAVDKVKSNYLQEFYHIFR